jgi:repressor LexA
MGRRPLLTKEKVLAALQRWTAGHGRSPSLEELRLELGVGSTRTVFRYLEMLEVDGAIERRPGAPGVKLLKPSLVGTQTRAVAIVGHAAAGSPMLAEENVEAWVRLPKPWAIPASDNFFLLHIRGTSMNKARVEGGTIDDGDLVLVHQQPTAKTGDIIVGLVDGEATVKRLVAASGYCVLKPDSKDAKHRPILVERDFRVLGKVTRVLKKGSLAVGSRSAARCTLDTSTCFAPGAG